MMLPGLFLPASAESSEGQTPTALATGQSGGEATGFGQLFSHFKSTLPTLPLSDSGTSGALALSALEAGQALPLERQSLGFQGIGPAQQSLLQLELSLSDLAETIDQLLNLSPEQQAALSEFLADEWGLSPEQQQDVFALLQQWQQAPPRIDLTAADLEAGGDAAKTEVDQLQTVLSGLNETLSLWSGMATGEQEPVALTDSRLASIRDNAFLSQWLLGESRPGSERPFNAADWLSSTMQNLMNAARSGSIPMTLEPMKAEAMLLTPAGEPVSKPSILDMDWVNQARQSRAEMRPDAASLVAAEPVAADRHASLLPAQQAQLAEDKFALATGLERLQRPVALPQANQVLSERLLLMIQNDVRQATIRLDPPELGMMDIRITMQNDQTQIQIQVQTPQVREALESQSARLREFLEQQGQSLGELDVSDQQQRRERDDNGEGQSPALASDSDLDERPTESDEIRALRPQGLVDHFV
ncbi:MAG: flagellar hook-length control protein FliK [Saccharospirillum sp.]